MPHILLVEEYFVIGNSIKECLEEGYHYQVTWIKRGDEARDKLQLLIHTFDLLILNEDSLIVRGTELCRAFRAHSDTTPIIITSANPLLSKECLDAGADYFCDAAEVHIPPNWGSL